MVFVCKFYIKQPILYVLYEDQLILFNLINVGNQLQLHYQEISFNHLSKPAYYMK